MASSVINQDAVVKMIANAVQQDIQTAAEAVIEQARREVERRIRGIVSKAALTLSAEYSIERLGNIIRIEVKTDG